jgi:hypothetical protein
MPFKLSEISGLPEGISGALQSSVHGGSATSLHDGFAGQLLAPALDGSLTPLVSAVALIAAGGLYAVRSRPLGGALPA